MKLDMVGIIVEDMGKAITFYQLLGFDIMDGEATDPYVELNNESMRISLNTKEMIKSVYGFLPEASGDKIELAFLLDSPEEIDRLVQKVRKAGYEILRAPWKADWGQYYAIIKDVDGNVLSLFCGLN